MSIPLNYNGNSYKPGGVFVVVDWLSPTKDVWGDRLKHMCEVEGLTLYAETEQGYHQFLTDAGFVNIQMRDEK